MIQKNVKFGRYIVTEMTSASFLGLIAFYQTFKRTLFVYGWSSDLLTGKKIRHGSDILIHTQTHIHTHLRLHNPK